MADQNFQNCSCMNSQPNQLRYNPGQNRMAPQWNRPYPPPGPRSRIPEEPRKENHNHSVDGKKLRKIIDQASFAMDDTRLYLDTHPDCKEAFAYYKKMEKIRNDAIKEYEIHCGSILSYRANETGSENWNWNTGILPWTNGCCNGRRV